MAEKRVSVRLAGRRHEEVPATLKRWEFVLSHEHAARFGGGGKRCKSGNININVTIIEPGAESFRKARSQVASALAMMRKPNEQIGENNG